MTSRLYHRYPEATEFEAAIMGATVVTDSTDLAPDRGYIVIKVRLDQTLFYPEGGGQPADTGQIMLSGQPEPLTVLQVSEEDGDIVHYVSCPVHRQTEVAAWPGTRLKGRIDWQRRFDHSQQHTGQHILTPAFVRLLGAQTTAFHLSRQYSSIDVKASDISAHQLRLVEREANDIVFQNLPITVQYHDPSQLPVGVRQRGLKEFAELRVVSIGDYDSCACGGTHLFSTGQVGPIKITDVSRVRGGSRVVFLCGWRALADYQHKHDMVSDISSALAVGPDGLSSAVADLILKEKETAQALKSYKEQILTGIAESLAQRAALLSEPLIAELAGQSADDLKWLAQETARRSQSPVIVFNDDPRFTLVIADVSGSVHAGRLARALAESFGARGGGSGTFAQIGRRDKLGLALEQIKKQIMQGVAGQIPNH